MKQDKADNDVRISEADAKKSVTHDRPQPKTKPPARRPKSKPSDSKTKETSSDSGN